MGGLRAIKSAPIAVVFAPRIRHSCNSQGATF